MPPPPDMSEPQTANLHEAEWAAQVPHTPRATVAGGNRPGTPRAESAASGNALPQLHAALTHASARIGDHSAEQILLGAAELSTLSPAAATMSLRQAVAQEALILLDDTRPSLLLDNGQIEQRDGLVAQWPQLADPAVIAGLERLGQSVGLVRLGDRKMGTAIMVGDGLLMTNQHVLQDLGPTAIAQGVVTVEFGDGSDGVPRHRVAQSFASPLWENAAVIDPNSQLDLALLQIEVSGGLPTALPIATADMLGDAGQPIAVIGFPVNRPGNQTGAIIAQIFGDATFGRKRLSPGRVVIPPFGGLPRSLAPAGDRRGWVFTHDAATTGGSSGSCVVALAAGQLAMFGLHFAGETQVANMAHRLGNRHLRAMVQDHALTWLEGDSA